jgi:uncharacterized membrane protein (UPF0182 family)
MMFNVQGGTDWSPFPPGDRPGLPFDPRRLVKWVLLLGGLVLLLVTLNLLRGVYTNMLWFDALEYRSVYITMLTTRVWLFVAGAIFVAALVTPNVLLAYRRSRGEPLGPMPTAVSFLPPEMYAILQRLFGWVIGLVVLVMAVVFGAILSGQWETLLRFFNEVPFTSIDPTSGQAVPVTDPIFHKNASFYVFTVPVLNLLQGWLLGAVIVTMLATASVYLLNISMRGNNLISQISSLMVAHVSVLLGILLFVVTWSYWIDIYELMFSSSGAIFGASYTDLNARLPALRVLIVLGSIVGILLLANTFFRSSKVILGGFALWVAAAIIVGTVYPNLVQRFQVDPNELSKESKYIPHNIQFTRQGFALDRIAEEEYKLATVSSGEFAGQPEPLTTDMVTANPETIDNMRLWDHRPLRSVYNQIQFFRTYYKFVDVDVDRYMIDGTYRQVMLGARELFPEDLPVESQSWVNKRLQFTHGYGVAMSPVNTFTSEGKPEFFIKDIPPKPGNDALIGKVPTIEQPQIYYGENSARYVVVNSRELEFDYPAIGTELPVRTNYEGTGGIPLSSLLRRAAYAWEFADINLLISGAITSDSRIQYHRLIQERVHKIAPFLRLDDDPYMVVADGKLWWMQDAYTTTSYYPYSEPYRDELNYIRNSVKVVVDAYSGDANFYIFDETDAIVQTYAKVFPELFKPSNEMPAALLPHIRYPEDFFSIQAEKYLIYHMLDTNDFYNREDPWSIPREIYYETDQQMEPYYVIMKLPGEEKEEFVLLLPFTPLDKPNQVAWLAARNDNGQGQYGTLKSFFFSKGTQLDGPQQVEARISNDEVIKEWFFNRCTGETRCIRGNLLVIPVADGDNKSLLYVEPIYMQAANIAYPELKQVIVADAKRVVMEDTFPKALSALMSGQVTSPPGDAQAIPSYGGPTGDVDAQLQQQIDGVRQAINDFKDTLAQLEQALGDLLTPAEREGQ